MDRTVPKTGSEEIELFMRTYYSLLRSTHSIRIETLEETHMAMESSLHVGALAPEPDISALVYASLRLPDCMLDVEQVLIGQVERSFVTAGYAIAEWPRVNAPGRRRRVHFDGDHTLAVFIASRSDIDDLVPTLTAYQIEWNKLHFLLQDEAPKLFLSQNPERGAPLQEAETVQLAAALRISRDDLRRLEVVWGERFVETLHKIAAGAKDIGLRMLAGSLADYRRGTAHWWGELRDHLRDTVSLEGSPVYFVSSNTHSLVNMLTGFARREERHLIEYIQNFNQGDLAAEYQAIRDSDDLKSLDNFLYYVLRKYLADHGETARSSLAADEKTIGIHRVPSRHGFDIETQVIEINKLRPDWLDTRLRDGLDIELVGSDALIINIDYPLGLASYEILNRVTERVDELLGVYIMGKAASLNARVGDVMIPNVVHDEHSQNTYLFNNCFSAQDVAPYLRYGTVLDNQKAVSARGTFLQNPRYMSVFYREGYTIVEMEAGPYLSAVYEAFRPQRHPYNEIVNLYGVPFETGFLYYASDTPMSKGRNLGAGSLSYAGIDPTYATAIAILRRIFANERRRAGQPINGRALEEA
ncbi:MAG: hypothetical protein HXY41_10355 [Chloroflexi bacterium]|nr:hypothetical protein [Chloroflexota bacterium]